MINSRQDYLRFIEADRIALNYPKYNVLLSIKLYLKRDKILTFQRLLRRVEYLGNTKDNNFIINKIVYVFWKIKLKNLSLKLGFSIPENVFGPGLAILHYGPIIVNSRTRIGANCRIHVGTNIGESGGVAGAPVIGNNVYIGPGAKIFGRIKIVDNVAIAANAAVNKDCLEPNHIYGGVPAKKIGPVDIERLIPQLRQS